MLILNLMPATHFNKVRTGATKDWESCGMLQKHLLGTFHRSIIMFVGEAGTLPHPCSQARMGQAPFLEILRSTLPVKRLDRPSHLMFFSLFS